MLIDWESNESHHFLNPRWTQEQKKNLSTLFKNAPDLPGHIWVTTSGTTSGFSKKWVALSKTAFLTSAHAVNIHLEANTKDIWLHALPSFHVGGLGIFARAHLSGSKIVHYEGKWNAQTFFSLLTEHKCTLTAAVPAQIHDCISLKLRAPKNLRAMVIGGGKLPLQLYEKGVELGWPLLPSYGLTECASQVATAKNSAQIFPLSHVSLSIKNGLICLKSAALLTGYLSLKDQTPTFFDPKENGWLVTEDRGKILQDGSLKILGRMQDLVKILGEWVDIYYLESVLEKISNEIGMENFQASILPVEDLRSGFQLFLIVESKWEEQQIQKLLNLYHTNVSSLERINQLIRISSLPKNSLGKVIKERICLSHLPSAIV